MDNSQLSKNLVPLATIEDMQLYAKALRPSQPANQTLALILASKQLRLNGNIEGLAYGENGVIMSSHLMRGLAIQGGVKITTLEDYVQEKRYLYGSAEKGEFVTEKIVQNDPDKFYVCHTSAQFIACRDDKEFSENKIVLATKQQLVLEQLLPDSYKTTIKFERNGQVEIVTQNSYEFYIAGLLDKQTFKKYPRACYYARVFTLGVKRIASDLLAGLTPLIDYYDGKNLDVPESEIQVFN